MTPTDNNETITSILDHEPQLLWREFAAISSIPRCTGSESAVLAYIELQAKKHSLDCKRDTAGNMRVSLPPTEGYEKLPGVIIQAHVDMVCEQNVGTGHNFRTDPIDLKIEDGWLKAAGTTLGADNGIGVAMMLALIKGDYAHGPLELLFTLDEEGGLIGAIKLEPHLLTYRRMINLDSEEEGIFYIGCAGGKETIGSLPLDWEDAPQGLSRGKISVTGLKGGHSGSEIHRQLGNSLVLASRILHQLPADSVRVYNISGGDKHNAIPREAFIQFLAESSSFASITAIIKDCERIFHREFAGGEDGLSLAVTVEGDAGEYPKKFMSINCQKKLSHTLIAIPNGVLSMSRVIEGLVSTSTNFAAMEIQKRELRVLTSQRSDIMSQNNEAANRVAAPFLLAGGSAQFVREYPGWEPNPQSTLLKSALEIYRGKTGKQAVVASIHAGLECGVIGSKFDQMDTISFGPTIHGAHTPAEKTEISSCSRVFDFFVELLVSLT